MEPSIKQLRYLTAMADHLHFRKAAEACFVTQPALSGQIQLLEEHLGVALFERGSKQARITPAGQEAAERARAILRSLDDLVLAAQRRSKPFANPITLGIIPTIAPYLLPKLLGKLRKSLPQLKLFLREEKTAVILNKMNEGALDLALLALPLDEPNFNTVDWYDEGFVFVSPPNHRLHSIASFTQKKMAGESILLLDEGHCFSDQALEVCSMAGAVENKAFRASSLNTLVQMVANGLGVTLLPRLAVNVEVKGNPQLAHREFAGTAPSRRVGLAWRKNNPRYHEFLAIVKHFKKYTPADVALCDPS